MKKFSLGFTDGTFDMFHVGHLNVIEMAKQYCDKLIVGVHGDDVVATYKSKPIINENDRCRIINALKMVDKAVINRTRDKLSLWDLYHFDVVFIGDDWKGTERWNKIEEDLNEHGVEVIYLPYTKGISTTAIKEKVKKMQEKA